MTGVQTCALPISAVLLLAHGFLTDYPNQLLSVLDWSDEYKVP
nr:hypothetical protein [Enterococcus faecium]